MKNSMSSNTSRLVPDRAAGALASSPGPPSVRLPSPSPSASSGRLEERAVFKLPCAIALGLIGALPMQPGWAQANAPDASAFQRGPWAELGELPDGATLSISQARYRDGSVLTFALKTVFAAGDNGSTIDVIELDCAAARYRRISAATSKRNGEMSESNEAEAFEAYPEGSLMAQLAVPLCERVSGG